MTETSRNMPEVSTPQNDQGMRTFLLGQIAKEFRRRKDLEYYPLYGLDTMNLPALKKRSIHDKATDNEGLLSAFEVVREVLKEQGYSAGATYNYFMSDPLYLPQEELHFLLLDTGPRHGVISGEILADRFLDLVKKL